MTDWIGLLTPLIIVLVPTLIGLAKRFMKSVPALQGLEDWLTPHWPIVAPVLGAGLDQFMGLISQHQANPRWGLLYGLAGVAVREIMVNYFGKSNTPSTGGTMKLLLTAFTLLAFAACSTAQPAPPAASTDIAAVKAVADAPQGQDPLTKLAQLPLWDKILADAKKTIADADSWAGQVSVTRIALAKQCPNALLVAIPDLQARILALRDTLLFLKKGVLSDVNAAGPYPLDLLTTIEYGPKQSKPDAGSIVTDIRDRFRLVANGCSNLGYKALNDLMLVAGKLGIAAEVPGLPAAAGIFSDILGKVPLQ